MEGQKMDRKRQYMKDWYERTGREQAKEKRAKERATKPDQGKDVTRTSRLSELQLYVLYNKIPDTVRNENGLSMENEYFHCYETSGRLNWDGYPCALTLPAKYITETDKFSSLTQFKPTAVVLAVEKGEFAKDPQQHASHLCGNRRCFRGDHLIWESAEDNQNRKGCVGILRTVVRAEVTDIMVCRHEPKCIILTVLK